MIKSSSLVRRGIQASVAIALGFIVRHLRQIRVAMAAYRGEGTVFSNLPEPLLQEMSNSPLSPEKTDISGDRTSPLTLIQISRLVIKHLLSAQEKHNIPVTHTLFPPHAAELAVTWMGHASVLIELDGQRILTDPVWSKRCSPSSWMGPTRLHPPTCNLTDLPELDTILISHDHYDHLDERTIRFFAEHSTAVFLVPKSVGAHLSRWGVPTARIIERSWWESANVDTLRFTCAPARHFSGRGFTRNTTLWASWSITGPQSSVYFGGDSGYSHIFDDMGKRLGEHDLTIIPIGAYSEMWREIHMNPEEAVRVHRCMAKPGGVLLPIHWGTFRLAPHPWAEPITWLQRLDHEQENLNIVYPQPGQRLDLHQDKPDFFRWWEGVTYRDATV